MGRTIWFVAASSIALLSACGGKKDPKDGKGSDIGKPLPPPPGAGAFTKLEVMLDGKQVPMETAIVKSFPDGRIQLYVSPKKVVTCKELLVNVFNEKGLESVLVDLPTHLEPDGKLTYGVSSVYMGMPSDPDPGGTATVSAMPTKDSKVDIELAFTAKTGREQKLSVKGSLTAEGCGEQDAATGPGIPKQALASTATMTVAGKKFPIKGAIRKGDTVELSDFPRDCTTVWFASAKLEQHGKAEWILNGRMIAVEQKSTDTPAGAPPAGSGSGSGSAGSGSGSGSAAPAAKPFTLATKAGKSKAGAGSGSDAVLPTVELALSGEGMIGKYAVSIDGTVEAIDCKN